ncbi:MAG TPA: hypothetical protein VHD87_12830 [Acidimicrobiales bacterium]|nr:hypothetical protein [Acidimicrobiales bacterium]
MTLWRDALDARADIVRYLRSPLGVEMTGMQLHMNGLWEALRAAQAVDGDIAAAADAYSPKAWKDMSPAERRAEMGPLVRELVHHLDDAVTWAVTADMVQLVSHAGESMPVESIERVDLPSPHGFVLLEDPLYLPHGESGTVMRAVDGDNDHGEATPFRAVQWSSDDEGVEVVCHQRRGDYATHEAPLSPADEAAFPKWRVGVVFSCPWGSVSQGEGVPTAALWLKALWTISQQTIADVTPRPADRAARRQFARDKIELPDDGTVRVVTLRRPRRPTPDEHLTAAVDWSHRWVVSGHWRNQFLPSTGMHRLQWISDYIKGPEDKPLVLKDTVINMRR